MLIDTLSLKMRVPHGFVYLIWFPVFCSPVVKNINDYRLPRFVLQLKYTDNLMYIYLSQFTSEVLRVITVRLSSLNWIN